MSTFISFLSCIVSRKMCAVCNKGYIGVYFGNQFSCTKKVLERSRPLISKIDFEMIDLDVVDIQFVNHLCQLSLYK